MKTCFNNCIESHQNNTYFYENPQCLIIQKTNKICQNDNNTMLNYLSSTPMVGGDGGEGDGRGRRRAQWWSRRDRVHTSGSDAV